jgi:hypothetical protein
MGRVPQLELNEKSGSNSNLSLVSGCIHIATTPTTLITGL